jgi:uncharacterized repeat protein (TIGR03803 family)
VLNAKPLSCSPKVCQTLHLDDLIGGVQHVSGLSADEEMDMSERFLMRKPCTDLITNLREAAGYISFLALLAALVAVACRSSQAQTENVLYSFTNGADGANPTSALVLDASGNLYGTTDNGGSTTCTTGCGTVFRLSPRGTDIVLYRFLGGPVGAAPYGGLVRDVQGNLYGTTYAGGFFVGTVYEIQGRKESVLHTFLGSMRNDGAVPYAGLIMDADGNLYGTSFSGGTKCTASGGCGTVFRVTPSGSESLLYSFAGGTDGSFPFCALAWGANNSLYGTTVYGGANNLGTAFKVAPGGGETVVHSFGTGTDGSSPEAGLVAGTDGRFYGTTSWGGDFGFGTVFEIDRTGAERVVYSFTGGVDGANPDAPLILDSKGSLYGTTYAGGMTGNGTVFEIDTNGIETVLYSFAGGADGANPGSAVVFDAKGNLYGTTINGGASGYGTVFRITP